MKKSSIYYFEQPKSVNVADVIKLSVNKAVEEGISKIVVFAANFSSVKSLYDMAKEQNIEIVVATYSANRKFYRIAADETKEEIVPELVRKDMKEKVLSLGIKYIQGGIPLEPVSTYSKDSIVDVVTSTLSLISVGLIHCVNACIMAYESGCIEDDEEVIAMTGDTSVIITGASKRELFSGKLRVKEIICKPL